jgi:predicted GTPase
MHRWQFVLVAILVLLPIVMIIGVGGWTIWSSGHWLWLCWAVPICWTAAGLLLHFSKRVELPIPEIGSKLHWTPRDHAAMQIIEEEQKRVCEFTGDQLVDPQFYTTRAIDLATTFAKHYHPNATDPLGSASVIELLTVIQLVAEDLEELLRQNVPGSHLVSVSQWRMLANAPAWWRTASNYGWIASVLMNPTNLARYAVSRAFVEPVSKQLQTNMLGTVYIMFVRQLGFYLIELNSGRLRGGSALYRSTMRKLKPTEVVAATSDSQLPVTDEPVTVTIAVIGQVKAGKSSLVNCLLGEQKAAVDVLPLTQSVQRYDLHDDDRSDRLILLDTPGYNDSGATLQQLQETRQAVRDADLILLVLDARSPAKQADIVVLDDLSLWFQEQHRLKPPSILGIVSKIDGLSPVLEWSPPYSWEAPVRPKEKSIRAALDFARQTFGDRVDSLIPVCTDLEHNRVFGIEEYLLPTISLLLDEARAVSLVRSIHRNYDQQRVWQVVKQLISAGSKIREYAPEFAKSQFAHAAKTILTNAIKK